MGDATILIDTLTSPRLALLTFLVTLSPIPPSDVIFE